MTSEICKLLADTLPSFSLIPKWAFFDFTHVIISTNATDTKNIGKILVKAKCKWKIKSLKPSLIGSYWKLDRRNIRFIEENNKYYRGSVTLGV
jgi:hypothetical protein